MLQLFSDALVFGNSTELLQLEQVAMKNMPHFFDFFEIDVLVG